MCACLFRKQHPHQKLSLSSYALSVGGISSINFALLGTVRADTVIAVYTVPLVESLFFYTKFTPLKKIEVKKGQILQRKGDLNSKVYHVEAGLLRSYAISDKGKEHIYTFAPEGWIMADNVSPDEPCDLFIDAIEDAIVWQKEKDHQEEHDIPKLIKRLGVLQKRMIMLMCAAAIERYEHFIETYPDIVQRVPQKMIASYLGITPEALSAVRSKRSRNP